jgi:hypothetical protein
MLARSLGTILVGTADGLHVLGQESRTALEGHEVTALARGRGGWWAILDACELWRAVESGRWERAARLEKGRLTCLGATSSGLLVGTAGAHLLRFHDGRLVPVTAFDLVEGRRAWHTPWGEPPDTRSIAAERDGAVYVNVHVGGVVRSRDGGQSWRPTLDIEADVHQVLAHPTITGLVLVAAAVGLGTSHDGGGTWQFETEGLHGRYLRAVAIAGDTMLVSASGGPSSRRAAVYRRPVATAQPFERCRTGLPEWFGANIDTYCLATAGSTVAMGTEDGGVWVSPDAGRSWQRLAKGLPAVHCLVM